MLKNIFTVAFRSIWRQKGFSIINILGLALGITACILIFLFVEYETSFDKHHARADEIYRISSVEELPSMTVTHSSVPHPLAPTLQMEMPDYDITGLYNEAENTVKINSEIFKLENILYVDTVFFKMFDVRWLKGNTESLKDKNSLAITEKIAKTWFGDEDPIGKIVVMDNRINFKIVGVLENSPLNTCIPYQAITSYDMIDGSSFRIDIKHWGMRSSGFECYIALNELVNKKQVADRVNAIHDKNNPRGENETRPMFFLQPLLDIHFEPDYVESPNTYATSRKHILVFASIGLLILILACINFVNLATAQAIKKAKEVGIRKVVGAYRSQVFLLFISETILMTLISIFFAFILAEISLPYFNSLIGNQSNLSIYSSSNFVLFIIAIVILVMFLAGFYPGTVLSRFNPIKVLKTHISKPTSKINIRTVLVVLQFSISIILVICTLVINLQVKYMKNKELGFKTKNILSYALPNPNEQKMDLVENQLKSMPEILNYTFAFSPPSASDNFTSNYYLNDKTDNNRPNTNVKMVDENYLATYGLELVVGRWVTKMKEDDTVFDFVVNEKLVKENNLTPEEILGMKFQIGGFKGNIVGVVKDFHLYDMRSRIGTTIFIYFPKFFFRVMAETTKEKSESAIAKLNKLWAELFPDNILEYEFLEDQIEANYDRDTRTLKTIQMFSILGIVIALLGLFGLVSYMVTQQTRAIGIRKVLGSSVSGIIRWISSSYIKMVLISNLIAWPVSYLLLQKWLDQFAFRISMPWILFFITAIGSLIIAYGTIMLQTIKVSRANPVEAIKYE